MVHSPLFGIFGTRDSEPTRSCNRPTAGIRSFFAVVTLLSWSPTAAAQHEAFLEALSELQAAIEGTFGDEGPRIQAALDAMAASLKGWTDVVPVPIGPRDRPLLPLAAYAAGYRRLARGEYDEAIAAFRAAAAGDPLLADPAAGSEVMKRASAALRRGVPAQAQALLDGSPWLAASAEAHRILGLAYWAASQDRKAIEHLQAASRRNPRDERSRLALSRVLSSVGRDEDAERVLHDTLAVIPDSVQARWLLAASYERQGRSVEARREFERVAEGAVSGRAPIYAAIGRLARQAADFAAALEAFGRAVEANPADAALHRSFAEMLRQLDRADEALAELAVAVQINSTDADGLAAIGQIHLDAGRPDEAVRALERALHIMPGRTDVRYALATALRRLGRTAEAEREFTRVEQEQQRALDERRRSMSADVKKEDAAWHARQRNAR
jgi:tetratricopeptide (TPR) repeat protein